jgi:hypothetical protein
MVHLFSVTKTISPKGFQMSIKEQIITLQIGITVIYFDKKIKMALASFWKLKLFPIYIISLSMRRYWISTSYIPSLVIPTLKYWLPLLINIVFILRKLCLPVQTVLSTEPNKRDSTKQSLIRPLNWAGELIFWYFNCTASKLWRPLFLNTDPRRLRWIVLELRYLKLFFID